MDPSPINPSESIATANPTSEVESSTVAGVKGDIIDAKDTALDAEPKTQAEVETKLGGESSVSTPGLAVPGGWTDKPATLADGRQATSDVQGLLASVGQTAYSYLPESLKGLTVQDAATKASTTASETTAAVAETTSGAVAAAVAAVSPGGVNKNAETMPAEAPNTLPSQDKDGQVPLSGPMDGVGALPGGREETNVAVLPDEKKDPEALSPLSPVESTTTAPATTASSATAAVSGAVGAVTATVTAGVAAAYSKVTEAYTAADPAAGVVPEGTTSTTKPSEETAGAEAETGGPVGGVGSLPGKPTEEGVAVLPDEKANPAPLATASDEYAKIKTNAALANPYEGGELKGENAPEKSKASNAVDTAKEKVENLTTSSNNKAESTSAASSTTPSAKKRVSMGDKLKGNMKILSGKLSNNEAKVEAGRALKTGN